jgi:hypothetical protein
MSVRVVTLLYILINSHKATTLIQPPKSVVVADNNRAITPPNRNESYVDDGGPLILNNMSGLQIWKISKNEEINFPNITADRVSSELLRKPENSFIVY